MKEGAEMHNVHCTCYLLSKHFLSDQGSPRHALTLLNCSSVILRLTCASPCTAQIRSWRTTLCFALQYFEWHDSTKCVAFLQIMSDARPSVTVALPQIVAQLCRKWKTWATSLATDWAFSACSSCRGELFSLLGWWSLFVMPMTNYVSHPGSDMLL